MFIEKIPESNLFKDFIAGVKASLGQFLTGCPPQKTLCIETGL